MKLEFDDPCYYAAIAMNPEPSVTHARIYYSSLTTPGSLYNVDLTTGEKTLLKQQKVLGDFNAEDYQSERLMVSARDGVKVPVSLVYRKDSFKKDGSNPLFQYGYGAYGITIDPSFSRASVTRRPCSFRNPVTRPAGGAPPWPASSHWTGSSGRPMPATSLLKPVITMQPFTMRRWLHRSSFPKHWNEIVLIGVGTLLLQLLLYTADTASTPR